ncbi:MAG: hypothetical protein ACYTFQ_27960 [Planctomycetota bacterium]
MRSTVIRTHLLGFIWIAAAIDIWCCQFLTPADELNPLARWLLVQHGTASGGWCPRRWSAHGS